MNGFKKPEIIAQTADYGSSSWESDDNKTEAHTDAMTNEAILSLFFPDTEDEEFLASLLLRIPSDYDLRSS